MSEEKLIPGPGSNAPAPPYGNLDKGQGDRFVCCMLCEGRSFSRNRDQADIQVVLDHRNRTYHVACAQKTVKNLPTYGELDKLIATLHRARNARRLPASAVLLRCQNILTAVSLRAAYAGQNGAPRDFNELASIADTLETLTTPPVLGANYQPWTPEMEAKFLERLRRALPRAHPHPRQIVEQSNDPLMQSEEDGAPDA